MSEGRSSGLGWFYLGAAIGAVLAAGAVVVATEMQHGHRSHFVRRRGGTRNPLEREVIADELHLVEGLTHVVSEGLNVMADAVSRLSDTFGSARREAIRYGLGSDESTGGGSSHGWYTGEDEDEEHHHPPRTQHSELIHDEEFGDIEPLPS